MAITTRDGTKLGQNVISDVNANVAVSAGPARQLSPEAALLFNKSLVARPLMAPEVSSIRIKNTEYRYRWVALKAQNGQFYNMRRSQGFVNATTDDVEVLGGDATATSGALTAGDLILMKIRADLYDGAILHNMQKAGALSRARGMHMEGISPDVFSDDKPSRVSVAQEPFARTGKAQPFIPDNPDAFVDNSISSGRAEKTRQVVDGLREGAK